MTGLSTGVIGAAPKEMNDHDANEAEQISNRAAHVEIHKACMEIGCPTSNVLAIVDLALGPEYSGDQTLRASVAFAAVNLALSVARRERDLSIKALTANGSIPLEAQKAVAVERRRISCALSTMFEGAFREVVMKHCGLDSKQVNL